ncbi:SpoIIE family protein phosphatase [Streptomyces sp. NPDC002851]
MVGADSDPALQPGGLLDELGVAAVVLDADGRIVLWSPQAEDLFGYPAAEALGRPAAKVLVDEEDLEQVLTLYAEVMADGTPWAGVFPVRCKDGSRLYAEFRNMRLEDDQGRPYALGLASDRATVQRIERDLALTMRLVEQSPIGLAILDTNLRYVLVNPALERINGVPAGEHLGRTVQDVLPFLDVTAIAATMRDVLHTGAPVRDSFTVGRTPADPNTEHAWSVSFYRLEDPSRGVLGLAVSVVDVTEQHRAATAADRARRRLAMIADATERIGTTLDLDLTARELADSLVPELADIAAVDLLEAVLQDGPPSPSATATRYPRFRALALKTAYPTPAVQAPDPVGRSIQYDDSRLVAKCIRTGRPVLVAQVGPNDMKRIARDENAAKLLAEAGVHSFLAVPLRARGTVLGALTLARARNPRGFDHDDLLLAGELASRAAISIDNARGYQEQSQAALALQRHLLPVRPPRPPGLEVAYRYRPASTAIEVGGDWFDVIPLPGHKTALVVGDVMGSGLHAAATMGQLRTATRTLAGLGLEPTDVLTHLDRITADLGETIATCVYAEYDPHSRRCRLATAGHLPPVRTHTGPGGGTPSLLDLPTGAPLGVGGVPFEAREITLAAGDELVLYTDGLVESRGQDIDTRLQALPRLLDRPRGSLEETCDLLLNTLRDHQDPDDVALLIARTHPYKTY